MIESFLHHQPESPHGNFLAGKVSEALGMTKQAILAFQKSYNQGLEMESVLKICKIACTLPRNKINRQFQMAWYERGLEVNHRHTAVNQLREVLKCRLTLIENLKLKRYSPTVAMLDEMRLDLMKISTSSSQQIKGEMQEMALQNYHLAEKPEMTASAAFLKWAQQHLENKFLMAMDE